MTACAFEGCPRFGRGGYCAGHQKQLLRGEELRLLRPRRLATDDPACGFPGCPNIRSGRYCPAHTQQFRDRGFVSELRSHTPRSADRRCTVAGCPRPPEGASACQAHARQIRLGRIPGPIREPSEIIEDGASLLVVLRDAHHNEVGRTRIDSSDRGVVEGIRWHMTSCGYAARRSGRKIIGLHREIMSPPTHLEVDHINGDPLDNRRSNLRIVTHAENLQNKVTPGRAHLRNVTLGSNGRFAVWVSHAGRARWGGSFSSVESARDAARELRARIFTHANEERHK